MGLSDEARGRLADLVELQPTTNGELADLWGLADGSAVHGYLEDELADYYERNDGGYIVTTAAAADAVDATAAIRTTDVGVVIGDDEHIRRVARALPAPDERAGSVVSILHAVREAGGDSEVDDVRNAITSLDRAGIVETVQRTVPTYKLAVSRDRIRFAD